MMHWYNYLFAALAMIGIIGITGIGMPRAVVTRNGVHMTYCFVLLFFWIALFGANVWM